MQDIVRAVEKNRKLILEAERYIWQHPETGYKEVKTSKYMEEQFEKLGYTLTRAERITGFYTQVDTGRAGPEILVLGELDAVICRSHKDADPETGAVHACGHNAQCAALLGVAAALKDEKVLSKLCGKIRLCCVPAEECLEMEYRAELRKQGKISYFGGKTEFLSRGYFDDVDIAFMVHLGSGKKSVRVGPTGSVSNGGDSGFIAKTITYKGVTAHAACGAHMAKNALYAATCGLNAANALRETFKDADRVRWHPIITHGGDIVNNIPENVVIESQLRAATFEALEKENKKINRALIGAALSFGVDIDIADEPGYAPLRNDEALALVAQEAFLRIAPEGFCPLNSGIGGGTTDMGDLSAVMPVIHAYVGGACGTGHGNDYEIYDKDIACIFNAEWQLATLRLLLENNGARARKIVEGYQAPFASREELLAHQDAMRSNGGRIKYLETGEVDIRL